MNVEPSKSLTRKFSAYKINKKENNTHKSCFLQMYSVSCDTINCLQLIIKAHTEELLPFLFGLRQHTLILQSLPHIPCCCRLFCCNIWLLEIPLDKRYMLLKLQLFWHLYYILGYRYISYLLKMNSCFHCIISIRNFCSFLRRWKYLSR